MRYDERLAAQKRHAIWTRLCEIADQLHELEAQWWEIDTDLVDAHYDRCRIKDDQHQLQFQPGSHSDKDNTEL